MLDPMPSKEDLNNYYTDTTYWKIRDGKNYGINSRDLIHYKILKQFIPESIKKKVFLNFGAGHGGISNMFWFDGMQIVNVEPSLLPEFYSERWIIHKDISLVKSQSIDIIYGSHSLEHVQNINEFKKQVKRILKPGGFLFFEVPNGGHESNGPPKRIHIPHTYYFKLEFFQKWFSNTLLCDIFDQDLNKIENWRIQMKKDGNVIRVLGQI